VTGDARPTRAGSKVTAEQARRELARRRLPRERRQEGRDEATRAGTFYLSKVALVAIAEGQAREHPH